MLVTEAPLVITNHVGEVPARPALVIGRMQGGQVQKKQRQEGLSLIDAR